MVVNNLPIWAQKCSTSIICVTLTCESFFPPSGSFLISFRGRGKTLFAEDPTTLSSLLGFEASPHIERVPLPLPLPRPVMLLTVNLSNHDLQLLALYKPLIFSAQFSITFNRSCQGESYVPGVPITLFPWGAIVRLQGLGGKTTSWIGDTTKERDNKNV